MERERKELLRRGEHLRQELNKLDFDTGKSSSQIVPIVLGKTERALSTAEFLSQKGMLAKAIRPPTVPEGSSRIRLCLSTLHSESDLRLLVKTLEASRDV